MSPTETAKILLGVDTCCYNPVCRNRRISVGSRRKKVEEESLLRRNSTFLRVLRSLRPWVTETRDFLEEPGENCWQK